VLAHGAGLLLGERGGEIERGDGFALSH
jgi:hypothetical protein